MENVKTNALAASYRADLLYYIERAKLGKCPPHWQAYCFGEIADAKGTDNYPADGDALLAELRRLVDTVPQITNRDENVAEIAAKNIAVQVDEWRRQNDIPFDKSTIAARPADADGGEFDTMDEALRYLYTCLNFPDSVLC